MRSSPISFFRGQACGWRVLSAEDLELSGQHKHFTCLQMVFHSHGHACPMLTFLLQPVFQAAVKELISRTLLQLEAQSHWGCTRDLPCFH